MLSILSSGWFAVCLLVLVFNQLAFAGVHIWAATLSQVLIFALTWGAALILLLETWLRRTRKRPGEVWTHPVLPFILLGLMLACLQLVPLDPSWVEALSPRALGMHQELVQAGIVERLQNLALSLEPWTSLRLLLEHFSQVLFFVLLLVGLKNRPRVLALVMVMLFLGLFQVLYGLIQTSSATPQIWWWEKEFNQEWLTGTYINRDHLAGFLELVIPLSFGLGLVFWPRNMDSKGNRSGPESSILKQKLLFLEQRIKSFLFIFIGVFLGAGLLFTGCRGAVISLALGTLIVSALFMFKRSLRGFGVGFGVFLLVIAVYGMQLGIEETAKRFEQTEGLTNRLEITKSVLPMVADYPLTGVGLGNFKTVYPEYELASWSGRVQRRYALNDWVQSGVEFGVPGLILVVSGYFFFLVRSLRLWLKTRDQFASGLGAGLLIGYIALGVHSFFDFNLHIPANIMSFAACLALLHVVLAQKVHRYAGGDREVAEQDRSAGLRSRIGAVVLFVGLSLLLLPGIGLVLKQHRAEALCPTLKNSTLEHRLEPEVSRIRQAIELYPLSPAYREELGRRYLGLAESKKDGAWAEIMLKRAKEQFEQGLTLSPADAYLWLILGETRLKWQVQRKKAPREEAIFCLKRAVELRPRDYRFLTRVSAWMLWAAEQERRTGQRSRLRQEGLRYLKRGLEVNPGSWRSFVDLAWALSKDKGLILDVFEDRSEKMKKRVEERIKRE